MGNKSATKDKDNIKECEQISDTTIMNSQKEYLEEHSHLNQGSEMQMEKHMQDTIHQSDINSSVDEALNDNQPKYDDTTILDMMNTSEKMENIHQAVN